MLVDPSGKVMGMDALIPYFQVMPFADILYQNYVFPGIALIIVNGITNIIASILLIQKKKIGIILGGIFGTTLMLWITIQFIIFPLNFMSTIYFIFGFIQAVTGYMCYVFYNQETFKVDEKEYKNIGKNEKELVVYFSRLGYTKKVALETANKKGAEILEIKAKERTEGTLGFWWSGRFGMHKWGMPIEEIDKDLSKYDQITICTPIWVFSMCAPIREFCKKYSGKIKNVDYIIVHYRKGTYEKVADEMDNILDIKRNGTRTVCSKIGKVVYNKEL